jgi:hypothetical protein
MKFGKLLARVVQAMPAEYRPMFLNYKLLKKHIFLNQRSACQCSINRQIQGLSEVVRDPALLGQPCHLCSRPVYSIERDDEFQFTVYDDDDDTAAILDLEYQCFAFMNLLKSELFKINRFFTSSMQYYVDTMHVSPFCHLNLLFFFVFESLVSFSEL